MQSQEELLYQAELDLVSQAGSTPARVRESTAFSTSTTLPVPGAWVSTPVLKRKRDEAVQEIATLPAWGIMDWKRLEKVHRKEKDAWLKERTIKPLPSGGFLSWAKRSFSRPREPATTVWDPKKVVAAFIAAEEKQRRTWDP